jgi:hypothetical protein
MMISSQTAQTFHFLTRKLRLAALTLLLGLAAPAWAPAGDDFLIPNLGDCQSLKVQRGNKVSAHGFGVGVQIYQWNGAAWIFQEPVAVLFTDAEDTQVLAAHFGGPTWQSIGGGKVVGKVLEQCTPDPDSIPWLLLSAASHEGRGIFSDVTFIQRLNTAGGKAPNVPGNFVGQVARVPYTADYFFYHKGH